VNNEDAKRIVSEGLERRRTDRNAREAMLEDQARQLRLTINDNHTTRTLTDAQRKALAMEQARKRREARAANLAMEQAREESATLAVRRYGMACMGILLSAVLTPIPWWAAVALAAGLTAFPVAHIIRLYCPMED
jgi:glutamyl-tRNA reductase